MLDLIYLIRNKVTHSRDRASRTSNGSWKRRNHGRFLRCTIAFQGAYSRFTVSAFERAIESNDSSAVLPPTWLSRPSSWGFPHYNIAAYPFHSVHSPAHKPITGKSGVAFGDSTWDLSSVPSAAPSSTWICPRFPENIIKGTQRFFTSLHQKRESLRISMKFVLASEEACTS